MEKDVILSALEAAAEHGIDVVTEAIQAFTKDDITLADIAALKSDIKPPEQYFDKKD